MISSTVVWSLVVNEGSMKGVIAGHCSKLTSRRYPCLRSCRGHRGLKYQGHTSTHDRTLVVPNGESISS